MAIETKVLGLDLPCDLIRTHPSEWRVFCPMCKRRSDEAFLRADLKPALPNSDWLVVVALRRFSFGVADHIRYPNPPRTPYEQRVFEIEVDETDYYAGKCSTCGQRIVGRSRRS